VTLDAEAARRWQQVKQLLDELLALERSQRGAVLERIGTESPQLRSEVESLLDAYEESPTFLPETGGFWRRGSSSTSWEGRVLGAYRLGAQVGEGGMGSVYRAVRADGLYERAVAVKLIRSELNTQVVLRRFANERQILARLEHPNIARLLDAGVADTGQPYLVLEYVQGAPLDAYCDARQLSLTERLHLFLQVLGAVQYAHAHLVIHRDLKPSNILVTAEGQARLLDFGIAKLLEDGEGRQTELTVVGGRALTPDYAAPEQIAGESVTTATDVFALGVLLYELLSGERPHGLKGRSRISLEDAILHTEALPLARVRIDVATAVARATTPRKLARALRGDLETIAGQALKKNPRERYATANAFAEDIGRFLRGDVVLARRDSVSYRAYKFARRHWRGIAAATAMTLTLLGGLAATSYEAEVASRQRDLALRAQSSSLTQTAAARLKQGDISGAMGILLEVLPSQHARGSYQPEALSVFHEARAADALILAMTGHADRLWYAAFSPDGRRVVTASLDNTARIWDASLGRELTRLIGHTESVRCAVFSPDGARVVTASGDKTARIWDVATGRELARLEGHTRQLMSVAFSSDGQRVVTASTDGTARVWDALKGRQLALLTVPGRVTWADFSPDGGLVATAADDQMARVWNVRTGRQLKVLRGHTDRLWSVAFSPDGHRIVTASEDRTARVWETATGNLLVVLSGHGDRVNLASFSPDGRRIATASDDGTARVWDAATGQPLARLSGHTDRVWSAEFSADGRRIVTASTDRTARIWDVGIAADVTPLVGHTGRVWSAAFSPDGHHVLTASFDQTARIWDSMTAQAVLTLRGHSDGLTSAMYSPDGRRAVTSSDDKTARVWDAMTGLPITQLTGHTDRVSAAAFSPDGARVVTSSLDKTARIWDAVTGRELVRLVGHTGRVWSAAYSADGRFVVTAANDNTARVWDAATGHELLILSGHTDRIWTACFSPDGRVVATGSEDRTARLWDARTGQQLRVFDGHEGRVSNVAFSPDGRSLVTTSDDRTARLWDVATGEQLALLGGHTDSVVGAQFSPDGRQVVTASLDQTARIFRLHVLPLATQIEWALLAHFDPLSSTDRARLGLGEPADVRHFAAGASTCDQAAAAPYDPDRRAPGWLLEEITADLAARACGQDAATASQGYERGRVLAASGRFPLAREALQQSLAQHYRAAGVDLADLLSRPDAGLVDVPRAASLYEQAFKAGVTIAGFKLGELHELGVKAQAGAAYLLPPDAAQAWPWYEKAAAAGDPSALARLGRSKEEAAALTGDVAKRRVLLLEALQDYAAAAERAEREAWPDDAWQAWRYHRASLARLLGREGLEQAVAEVYQDIQRQYAPPPSSLWQARTASLLSPSSAR
jgi:WD40 repeat protein/serine/threonine protein kinase/TPR repeat protein